MKEIDDTPLHENESEDWKSLCESIVNRHAEQIMALEEKIMALELRVANLETQRTPQDENDDPEWYS